MLVAAVISILLVACQSSGGEDPQPPGGAAGADAAPGGPPASDAHPGGGEGGSVADRPYELRVPAGISPSVPAPLVILLHGYGSDPAWQEDLFRIGDLVDAEGFLYAMPEGTVDFLGNRFWNATDACCDLGATGVDDVAYLNALVDDVASRYPIDPRRIYAVGHSNGGFMAHRLACDASSRFAAVVSVAGATWNDQARCQPSEPVSVLELHATTDELIAYGGGAIGLTPYPGARATASTWAAKNGCAGALADGASALDLESSVSGAETRPERVAGCPEGGVVELWTIEGGHHDPAPVHPAWETSIWGFLAAHPKPER